jgi:CheY-like chemotaxis protein
MSQSNPSSSSTSLQARQRVVAIDAHGGTVVLVRRMLEHFGHEVHTATVGRTGVDLVKSVEPDVVISSVKIPGLDGFQIANEIRRASLVKRPLMIVHTSYSKQAIGEQAKAAGFDLYLSKPLSLPELVRAVAFESSATGYEEMQL